MEPVEIVIGENWLFTIPLVDINGDPLEISSLERLKIQLIQHGRIKGQFQLLPTPDPINSEIRINPSVTTSIDYELTQSISSRLKTGELWLKIFMADEDTDFISDGEWLDIDMVKIADMV